MGSSGCGKTNALLNLIKQQDNDDYLLVDKMSLNIKYWNEAKCQYLIKKHGNICLQHSKNSKANVKYSNSMDDIYENTEEYNPNKKK